MSSSHAIESCPFTCLFIHFKKWGFFWFFFLVCILNISIRKFCLALLPIFPNYGVVVNRRGKENFAEPMTCCVVAILPARFRRVIARCCSIHIEPILAVPSSVEFPNQNKFSTPIPLDRNRFSHFWIGTGIACFKSQTFEFNRSEIGGGESPCKTVRVLLWKCSITALCDERNEETRRILPVMYPEHRTKQAWSNSGSFSIERDSETASKLLWNRSETALKRPSNCLRCCNAVGLLSFHSIAPLSPLKPVHISLSLQ